MEMQSSADRTNERGAGLAEYGLLLLLILIVCLTAMGGLATAINAAYGTASGIFN